MIQSQDVLIIFSRSESSPVNDRLDIASIKARIPMAAKPARIPMIIATIIINVCSVSLSFSNDDSVLIEIF